MGEVICVATCSARCRARWASSSSSSPALYLVVSTAAVAIAGSTTGRVVVIDCALFVAVPALAAGFERGRDYLRRADPVRPAKPVPLHLRVRLDSRGSFTPVVSALHERGVAVLGSLDHDAILCFGLPEAIERTPGVRSATPFAPSEKVEADLAAGRLEEWEDLPRARVQLVATFWSDVPIERAKDLVRATGALHDAVDDHPERHDVG